MILLFTKLNVYICFAFNIKKPIISLEIKKEEKIIIKIQKNQHAKSNQFEKKKKTHANDMWINIYLRTNLLRII